MSPQPFGEAAAAGGQAGGFGFFVETAETCLGIADAEPAERFRFPDRTHW